MKLFRAPRLDDEPLLGARAGAARQRVRRRDAGARLQRQEDLAQGRALRPEGRGRARQHLCLRGAPPRTRFAQAAASTIATKSGAPNERAQRSSMPSRRCSVTPSRPAARRCAITAAPMASLALSSTISASTIARASRARRRAAAARSAHACRPGARRSFARCARSSLGVAHLTFLSVRAAKSCIGTSNAKPH